MESAPVGTAIIRNHRYEGESASKPKPVPKKSAAATISRSRGLLRLATTSDPAIAPTARAVLIRPKPPAGSLNTSVAIMADVIWKFRPKVDTMPTMISSNIRSLRPLTYRSPSRICPLLRGALSTCCSSPVRINAKVKTGTANRPALTMKTHPMPTQSMIRPERAGPIRRAELNAVELRAIAFGSSQPGTSSETKAFRTGLSNAETVPPMNAKM